MIKQNAIPGRPQLFNVTTQNRQDPGVRGQRENKNKWLDSTLLPGLAAARGLTDSVMHSNAYVVKED